MEMRHDGFGKVVSLFGGSATLKYPSIAQVDAYWEALRDGRLMPARSEVDPRGFGSALEHAFMLERVAPGIGRIRISGTHMRDLLGMEVRGMPLTAFFAPDAREKISTALEAVVTTPQVADLTLFSPPGIGKPALVARLFLAPLSNDGRRSARILGCLESQGEIGRNPRRFVVEQVQMRRIVATAGATAAPNETPAQTAPVAAPAAGFAEPAKGFDHKPTVAPAAKTSAEKPYLRLVRSRD